MFIDWKGLFDRLQRGVQTSQDIEILREALRGGQLTIATGERAVALGGSVQDTVVFTGDIKIILSPDNARALYRAISGQPPQISVLWERELRLVAGEENVVVFSQDGQWGIVGRFGPRVFRLENGEQMQLPFPTQYISTEEGEGLREVIFSYFREGTAILNAAFSPDARWLWLAFESSPAIALVDFQLLITKCELKVYGLGWITGKTAMHGAFSPNTPILAVNGHPDNLIYLWDLRNAPRVQRLRVYTESITSIAFSPKGYLLACGVNGNTLNLWKASLDLNRLEAQTDMVKEVKFRPNPKFRKVFDFSSQLGRFGIRSASFSPNGQWLALGRMDDHTVRLLLASNLEEVWYSEEDTDLRSTVSFSPDSRWLAFGGDDGIVRLLDTTTRYVYRLQTGTSHLSVVAFTPNGQLFIRGIDGISLWHVL
jgi:WD40 repeat protein